MFGSQGARLLAAQRTEPKDIVEVPKGYVYVNNKELSMELADITDRAASTMFFGELFRGFAVTLAHIFKEPATINYPFEKGPLSPRFRGEHALQSSRSVCIKLQVNKQKVLAQQAVYMLLTPLSRSFSLATISAT